MYKIVKYHVPDKQNLGENVPEFGKRWDTHFFEYPKSNYFA